MTEAIHANGDAAPHAGRWAAVPEGPLTASPATARPTLIRYRVVERLARSPQDARYLAHRLDGGTLAELRVLSGDVGASAGLVRAFAEHAERVASAARDCPGIATVHECERVARGALLVTVERPPGATLREVLERDRPLAVSRAVRVAIQIAEALEQAHGLGLVHGGLRPDNVVLSGADETVALMHFGFDRLLGSIGRGRRHPPGADDRVYQAPEQASGKATVRSDVYALGALLHEMLTGGPPPLPSRLRGRPRPLREQRRDIPESLDALVTRALHPSPRRRPATISAMCTDLWAEMSPYGRPVLPDTRAPWSRAVRRRPLLLVAAVLGAGTLTVASGALTVWLGLAGGPDVAPTQRTEDPLRRARERALVPRPVPPQAEAPAGAREAPAAPPARPLPAPAAPPPSATARSATSPAATPAARGDAGRGTVDRGAAPRVRTDPGAPARPAPASPPTLPDRAARGATAAGAAPRQSAAPALREAEPPSRSREQAPPSAGSTARGDDSAPRTSTPSPRTPARADADDPAAIIDWLIGEGSHPRR